MIERLFLIRHGETLHNAAGIAQGWNDSALSARGEEQVAALAERVARLGVDALYSSPLQRALTTAEKISARTALPVQMNEDLREMSYGQWEGKSFLDVRRDDNDAYLRWIEDAGAKCPDGESHNDVRSRLERALQSVSGKRPAIVTHGTAIRIAVTLLLGLPIAASRYFAQHNAALNIFVRRNDRYFSSCGTIRRIGERDAVLVVGGWLLVEPTARNSQQPAPDSQRQPTNNKTKPTASDKQTTTKQQR